MRSNFFSSVFLVAVIGAAMVLAGCTKFAPGEWFFDDAEGGESASATAATGESGDALKNEPPQPYEPSARCAKCHGTIYGQWKDSMHANALRGPVMIAQTALDMKHTLQKESLEEQKLCVNCHGPIASLSPTAGSVLPFAGGEPANEGVSCVACHSLNGKTTPGSGGSREEFGAKVQQGRKYYGPIANPAANSFHVSETSDTFKDTDSLCASCHQVGLDRDKDKKLTKGKDLVLQTTFDEYLEYRKGGGTETCVDCHMRVSTTSQSVAELAQGSTPSPPRALHDHSFVGVDFPLDLPQDPQAAKRRDLLATAATMKVTTDSPPGSPVLSFSVAITNTTGHGLPTGFAFARQMWLEIKATGAGGTLLFSSGVLAKNADDLCDGSVLNDVLAPFLQGCIQRRDDSLVNIQLKLVDKISVAEDSKVDSRGEPTLIAAPGAVETVLQFVEGGPVGRKRVLGNESLAPLDPFETRVFRYTVPLVDAANAGVAGSGTLDVRLLFRSLPPYFLRAMDSLNAGTGGAPLGSYADKLAPIEMKTARVSF